jgi:hypothetical protein
MLVVGLGGLLILSGVVYLATRAIGRAPLSGGSPPRSLEGRDTLEPRGLHHGGLFAFERNRLGFALIALGAILLLASAILHTA